MNLRRTRSSFILVVLMASMLLGQMYNQASPSTIVSSLQSNNEDRMHPFLSQSSEEPSHPIFHNVTGSNVEVVQQRNDTVNQGAFVKAKWNTTVTIWYKIVNWDNTTYETPLLYGDDGGNYLNSSTTKAGLKMEYNYTTTENITITYLDEPVTLTNTSVSYFSVKLNLTADYISFYAIVIYTNQEGLKQVLLEGRGSPYPLVQNLISTNNAFFKTEATLEFFIQTENVTIHINATSLPVNSTYYIQYRSGTSDLLVGEFKEDKLDLGLNETNRDVNTTISLGQFEVGTKIDFRLKIRHNDTRLNYTRSVFEPALHRVEIFDGQPSLEFSVNTTYSRLGTFFFSFNASVPRGEITSYTLWINDTTQPNGYFEISTPNLKLNATNYTYSFTTPGVYQANFTVETAKGLSANKSLIVIFDNEKPFLEFTKPKGAIEGTARELEIDLQMFDKGPAGIASVLISWGDNTFLEVNTSRVVSHVYREYGTYQVKLLVNDKAGNFNSYEFSVTFIEPTNPGRVSMEAWVGLLTFGAISTITFLRRRK